ncbi:coiled-coil domain-containing protein [Paenibacillus albus]|uniref:Uncharacterized protein n=1 Tax=Paenibacillus albus TaxID=2495582 RepID=A0A3Q8X986_9BACL|nr:hypothetical protein [Paenibacillus albus]AZN43371.1 hypothetical protein EJC50_29520 [Paenibacillus albus]
MDQVLQERYDALENEKASLKPDNPDDRFRRTVIENEQQQIQDQAAEADRLLRQAEEVADIQLPEDYDARWGVVGANDEIKNLISQVKAYTFSVHNDELAEQSDQYRAKLQALEEHLADNVAKANQLEGDNEVLTNRAVTAEATVLRVQNELKDALSKRDNAVQIKEEAEAERDRLKTQNDSLNGQVNELEGMLRTYRSRQSAGNGVGGGLILTSTLKRESDEERTDRLKREQLEALNRQLNRRGIPPVTVPPSTSSVASEQQEEAETGNEETFQANYVSFDAVSEHSVHGEVASEAGGLEIRFAALEARVEQLEQRQSA